jgi:DNA-binding CsgD family transcriptional regulator
MTVRHFPISSEPFSTANAPFEHLLPHSTNGTEAVLKLNRLQNCSGESAIADLFWDALVELIPDGVMVVTRNLKLVHLNQQAKELCQTLTDTPCSSANLPSLITDICHRLMRQPASDTRPLVVENQTQQGLTVRIRANWLTLKPNRNAAPSPSNRQLILLLLKNCNEALSEELRIEQQKYDLTDREAEIWSLLRQENTYQEIAQKLQISLNTVKTHVKNVYAKKRSFQGNRKVLTL